MIKKYLFVALFFCLTAFVLVVNFKTPLIGEDFALSLPYSHQGDGLINKIPQIVAKIRFQSTNWNSRLGEQLAIVFLSFDKSWFNILNTLAFFLFCYLILVYATGDFPSRASLLFSLPILACLVVILTPSLGEIFFWTTGATNYLWALVVLLLFFLPYRVFISGTDVFENHRHLLVFFYVLAIFAGLTNENTVLAILLLIIAGLIYSLGRMNKGMRLPNWYWRGGLFLSVGYALLMFSPSTQIRQEYYRAAFGVKETNLPYYLQRTTEVIRQYFQSSKDLLLFTTAILIMFLILTRVLRWPLTKKGRANLRTLVLLLIFSFSSVAVLILVPYFEARALLLTWFFFFTLLTYLLLELYNNSPVPLTSFAIVILVILGLYQMISVVRTYSVFYNEALSRHYQIVEQVKRGVQDINVEAFTTKNSRELNTREDYLIATLHYPIYYGVQRIQIVGGQSQ